MFERKDAALKFKRGRNAFLECAFISVTWERESKPITWTWNRTRAMKDICRAHWDGPSTAYTEADIRRWCHARMEAIETQEARDAIDPVTCYWRSLSDSEKRIARQSMDWDSDDNAATQAYNRAHARA